MLTVSLYALLCVVSADHSSSNSEIDFDTQVIPILTKAGCNAGACHGAAVGRGEFKLSLLAGDPAADFQSIVKEFGGRRINYHQPSESLLIAKPTEMLSHEGGQRIEYEGRDAKILEQWISQGATRIQSRQLVDLQVIPTKAILASAGETIPLKAVATFKVGTNSDVIQVDVTQDVLWKAEDESAVTIGSSTQEVSNKEATTKQATIKRATIKRATIERAGQHVLLARYLNRVVPMQLVVPIGTKNESLSNTDLKQPRHNWIDDEILKTLNLLRLPIASPAEDSVFLRRVYLDLTGTLPTIEQTRDYLANSDANKSTKLIETLLASENFTDYWTFRLATLLRIHAHPNDNQAAQVFHTWLRKQVQKNTRYDLIVQQLLTATGDTHINGPANFYRVTAEPRMQAEYASELLLGVRMRCANCHNHPLAKWTQEDYHGLAAIFATVQSGKEITINPRGRVINPKTGTDAIPRLPGTKDLKFSENENPSDYPQELADWLTDTKNPYFAKAMVNRVWKALMGRGLIEPTDDLRETNPGTHPELLEKLAQDFIAHDYNLRHTIGLIAKSAAYARSSSPVDLRKEDDRFYSHAIVRPLSAEVFADAIDQVMNIPTSYPNFPPGTRAIQLPDSDVPAESLDILGRCDRKNFSCEAESSSTGLATKLHLINGQLINQKLEHPQSRLQTLLRSDLSNEELISRCYLLCLSRKPTPQEKQYWKHESQTITKDNRKEWFVDFLWGLLNCREFTTNH